AVLVAEHGVGEFLAVSRGAAVVDVEDSPAARGEHLVPEVERRAVLPVRASVDIDDEGMAGGCRHAGGLGEEGFDFEAIVVADEGEGLDLAEMLAGEDYGVQIGEPAGRGGARFE